MVRGHKIRLKPNKTQESALLRAAGTSRFVYNWALENWNKQYDEYKADKAERPTAYSLSRKWTQEKPAWASDIYRGIQTQAILNLGVAWINFWKHGKRFPVFKKKGGKQSFYIDNAHARIEGRRILLPKIGFVKMREDLRLAGKLLGFTISCVAGAWYVSVRVELPDPTPSTNTSVVGVDVGCSALAVASDGSTLSNTVSSDAIKKKLLRLKRSVSKKQKGSANRTKASVRVQRYNAKLTNRRKDGIHKFTTTLAKNHGTAVVETLDIPKMVKGSEPWMRVILSETAMKEVHRQLDYKMRMLQAPQFYPSSKTCSCCGHVKSVFPCNVRVYKCPRCGMVKDRDLNASINLRDMRWVTACSPAEPMGVLKQETEMETFGF